MKKLFTLLLCAVMLLGATALAAEGFNPDNEAGVMIDEIRATYGAGVPMPEGKTVLGAVAKQFQNEYWRTLKEGYEHAAKLAQEAG